MILAFCLVHHPIMLRLRRVRWWLLVWVWVIATVVPSVDVAEQTCEADGTCTVTERELSLSNTDTDTDTDTDTNTNDNKIDDALSCVDQEKACGHWADLGECDNNPRYMHSYCRRSCKLCPDQTIEKRQLTERDVTLGVDLGVAQSLFSDSFGFLVEESQTMERIQQSRHYMKTQTGHLKPEIVELCRNEHDKCTLWAVAGECETNPKYMKKSCAPACLSCDYLSIEGRCPIDPNAPQAWGPGDLNAMFTKLTSEPYLSNYSVQILSSPTTTGGPWLITMDNVLSEAESERLIQLGAEEGYERSADVGRMRPDGTHESDVNNGRTSTNAWCQYSCYQDEQALKVAYRLSNITGIPEVNSEFLQLLRYDVGQFYNIHHDYIPHHIDRQQGVRILTLYLYLNDVEAGGGTNFDQLGITVSPKRGRALLWPSVLDADPNRKDDRTTHQALPVTSGIKYGANAWFHMRDFKTPNREGCH